VRCTSQSVTVTDCQWSDVMLLMLKDDNFYIQLFTGRQSPPTKKYTPDMSQARCINLQLSDVMFLRRFCVPKITQICSFLTDLFSEYQGVIALKKWCSECQKWKLEVSNLGDLYTVLSIIIMMPHMSAIISSSMLQSS